jgi:DNA (cytosine-5)-methyltransferase 1
MEGVTRMNFRLGELFCGPGGIGYAAITAKISDPAYIISHAWANDYDKDTCQTYIKNVSHDQKSVICQDIRTLKYDRLRRISGIDALAFGFPCNDFSVVGEQKGIDGVYGPLYSFGISALKYFRPKWFLAENVGGLRNSNDGKTFKVILEKMFAAGYSVYPHLYKFEEYGIPQARHRIIIIGIRQDQGVVFKIPSTFRYKNHSRTAKDAIENPPIPTDAPNNELTNQSKDVIERLKYIKPGENAFTADIPQELQLNISGAKISQIYRRLDPNKPAYTVTGSGGGGTHVYHWTEPRALTNRERARLQTFPDDFEFAGSKESVRKQIGMAVPVDGARIVFEAILNSFAGIDYESIPASFAPLIQDNHSSLFNGQKPASGQIFAYEEEEEYIAL